jgi:O-Antigen ligase
LITAEPLLPKPLTVLGITLGQFQTAVVWLMFVSSFVAIIEPAPSDLLFIVAVLSFLTSGLSLNSTIAPLILYLLLYNVGGFLSYLQVLDENKARMFVITSSYMAVSAIFLAFYIGQDTLRRLDLIKRALTIASVLASIIGIAGYFSIGGFVGGAPNFRSEFTEFNRAVGLFKDPNVFSTYLIFPALMLIQDFMLGTQRRKFISAFCLLIILAALFLAFSRGAWISFVSSFIMLVGLTFVLTSSTRMRSRIIIFTVIGTIAAAFLLAMLLSIEQVRNLFLDRFSLVKSYDSGETGRFGNQLNSIPLLLERPFGFGPFQFRQIFGNDPHNVYINSFGSYGWLGGISYFVLIVSTLIIGFRSLITRTPWQNYAIVVYCPLVSTIFQGVQIDTDHWRHFYWILGLTWGLFAASLAYRDRSAESAEIVGGWNLPQLKYAS